MGSPELLGYLLNPHNMVRNLIYETFRVRTQEIPLRAVWHCTRPSITITKTTPIVLWSRCQPHIWVGLNPRYTTVCRWIASSSEQIGHRGLVAERLPPSFCGGPSSPVSEIFDNGIIMPKIGYFAMCQEGCHKLTGIPAELSIIQADPL